MKNSTYWRGRFEDLKQTAEQQGIGYYEKLEKQYKRAIVTMGKEIDLWYARFAKNNTITLQEAKKMLNSNQLEEFKWSVDEYIKRGQENALSGKWVKQLENASSRVHISRLEALQIQMQQHVEVAFGNQVDHMDALARNAYTNSYYKTAFEIQKGMGIGYSFGKLDTDLIDKLVKKPWTVDGNHFSQRIWGNQIGMVKQLNTHLVQSIIRGDAPDKVIGGLAKKMNTSKGNAGRLIMTESAFFSSQGQADSFKELGVEQYEIVATLDNETSEICSGLDGKVFDMKDYTIGLTANPFHPWCRTTTAPYFKDDYFGSGERAAKNADKKTYYVPDDMTYRDWKKSVVDGTIMDLQKIDATDIMKGKQDEVQALKKTIMEKHTGILTDAQRMELDQILSQHDSRELTLYGRLAERFRLNDYHYRKSGAAYYPGKQRVLMNMDSHQWEKAVENGRTGAWKTKFHEEFHQLDHILSQTPFATLPDGTISPYKNIYTHFTSSNTVIGQRMIESIDADVLAAINSAVDWRNQDRIGMGLDPIFKHLKGLERISGDASESLLYYLKAKYNTPKLRAQIDMFTDAVGLTTKNRIAPHGNGFWGHDASYNKDRAKDGAASETWATFGSLFFSADDETKQIVKGLMPKTWETYESALNEVMDYAMTNGLDYK